MAEPWIRVHADLGSKPVTQRAADALGVKRAAAAGHLVFFWGNVSRHATNGVIAHYPDALLELWACWEGTRGRFAKFIRDNHLDDDGRVREWDEYAGALEQRKQKNREHQAAWRARRKDDSKDDVSLTSDLAKGVTKRNDTKRNEEDQKQLLAENAKPPRSRPLKAVKDKEPAPHWVRDFGQWWVEHVGAVDFARLGKEAKSAFDTFGLERMIAGATVYNDPQEGPPRKHWLDFLGNCAFWVQLAEMPMVDANGNETARMKRIPTKPRVA